MISRKKLKDLEFETLGEYYEYIYLSEVNGQRQQVYRLIKDMSKKQMKESLDYIQERFSGRDADIVKGLIMEMLGKIISNT